MAKNLLIVESPAKAKTIEKYLGGEFTVVSSKGHIRDLAKGNKAINIENGFEPTYIISEDKEEVVKELKKLAKKAEEVWLATDEDREGEAISWHLCEALGLDVTKTKRIVFHEITKNAINNAIGKPRLVDMNLVAAQQARRVLDRIVGFELSPILWRKLSAGSGLSAGRVQSVAVRLIVEKERDIISHNAKTFYKVVAYLIAERDGKPVAFKAELANRYEQRGDAENFLKSCINATYKVSNIEVKPGKRTPAAPFTTSTLQQEASRKLYMNVSRTMMLAQRLYEAGHITYMRTDSVNLSDLAMQSIKQQVTKLYGPEFHQARNYKNKTANAQEAHEAIRPTFMENIEIDVEEDQLRLYQLIWRRTMASQMADAELERTVADISISTNQTILQAKGEVIKFEGFLKVYMEGVDDDAAEDEEKDNALLPPLSVGQVLNFKEMTATQRFSQAPSRYTEAALVKKLEELGIGRPSTYAPTINTVQQRGYVEKKIREGVERKYEIFRLTDKQEVKLEAKTEITGAEKNKLSPTDLGMLTSDFLVKNFENILDYTFTARIEQEFDDIAAGQLKWNKMLSTFYKPFHDTVEHTIENAERVSGERELGIDPKSGKRVIARMGRFGPMVQIGESGDDTDKPKFAKLKPNQSISSITMEEAMELFSLPRTVGVFEDMEVVIGEGRFGPYVVHDKKFYSIKKGNDPYTLTLDDAIRIIEEKRNSVLRVFEGTDISIVEGRWGPYIKAGKKNVRLPKDMDVQKISLAEVNTMVEAAPEKKGGWGARKKKTK